VRRRMMRAERCSIGSRMIDTLYILLSIIRLEGWGEWGEWGEWGRVIDVEVLRRWGSGYLGMAGQSNEGSIMEVLSSCIEVKLNEYNYGGLLDYITGLLLTNHTKILIPH
jgi:hypothetical protein